jgi:hypothetical protein
LHHTTALEQKQTGGPRDLAHGLAEVGSDVQSEGESTVTATARVLPDEPHALVFVGAGVASAAGTASKGWSATRSRMLRLVFQGIQGRSLAAGA